MFKISPLHRIPHVLLRKLLQVHEKEALSPRRQAMALTKSELIERIVAKQQLLTAKDVELAVKTIVEQMSESLSNGGRIEIRGFGSFSLHYREPRVGRNPKTGEAVTLVGKYVPHFKPGKELKDRVNESLQEEIAAQRAPVVPVSTPGL
ncbi:MAG: integration host factor subunit beta [Pseudomonadota bacterium]